MADKLAEQLDALRDMLTWLVATVDQGIPKACGVCGTPNAACDGECADAVYFADGMKKARSLIR